MKPTKGRSGNCPSDSGSAIGGNAHGDSLLAFSCTAREKFYSCLLAFWKNYRSLFYITVRMRLSPNAGALAEAEL